MVGQQMPFQFTVLSSSDPHTFKDGQIISTFNKCGFFFCRRGNVEVSLEDKLFQIKPGEGLPPYSKEKGGTTPRAKWVVIHWLVFTGRSLMRATVCPVPL